MKTTGGKLSVLHSRVPLTGTMDIQGSKNAALPIIVAASLMPGGGSVFNVPRIADIKTQIDLLTQLGGTVTYANNALHASLPERLHSEHVGPEALMSRGSVYVIAAAAIRGERLRIPGIGGDRLAGRSLDLHFGVLRSFGIIVTETERKVELTGKLKVPDIVHVDDRTAGISPSCFALLLAAFGDGDTALRGVSGEPEVRELADYLRTSGVEIEPDGADGLTVRGTPSFTPKGWTLSLDRTVFGTYAAAAAATGGQVILPPLQEDIAKSILEPFFSSGCSVTRSATETVIKGPVRHPFKITTGAFPDFPSDLGPLMIPMMAVAPGLSTLEETIYTDRFDHVRELIRTGLDATIDGRILSVEGGKRLVGGVWCGTGIRESAALVISGLVHEEESFIMNYEALDRGYIDFLANLSSLGAVIRTE